MGGFVALAGSSVPYDSSRRVMRGLHGSGFFACVFV